MIENRIKELMSAIRKNAQQSKCIDRFEELLGEVPEVISSKIISDMNRYIEECMHIFKESDRMKEIRFKSRILTIDFIRPDSFFTGSWKLLKKYYQVNQWKEHTPFNPEKIILGDKEEVRKMVLLWNYVPAITKAILQTKRRSLGLDRNSKKFK